MAQIVMILALTTLGVFITTEGRPSTPIIRDTLFELPGNERISKRSIVKDDIELPLGSERISKRSTTNDEEVDENLDMETAANTIVFRPLFRTKNDRLRLTRSVTTNGDDDENMDTAANTIVFRPLFRSRDRDVLRSNRFRRSLVSGEIMETAADIVFRPLFRRRIRS